MASASCYTIKYYKPLDNHVISSFVCLRTSTEPDNNKREWCVLNEWLNEVHINKFIQIIISGNKISSRIYLTFIVETLRLILIPDYIYIYMHLYMVFDSYTAHNCQKCNV